MKKPLIAAALAVSFAALFSTPASADAFGMRYATDGVSIGIGIGSVPPAPYEVVPPPRPGFAWNPGYWAWDGYRYVWVQGRWVAAAPPVYIGPPAVVWGAPAPRWGYGWGDERWERHEHHEHRHGGWRDR